MKTNQTGHSRLLSVVSSFAFWIAVLLIAGLSGGLWFAVADGSAWEAVPLVAILALTAVLGITWQSRAGARRRLQAALDAYAEQEIRQHRRGAAWLPKNAD